MSALLALARLVSHADLPDGSVARLGSPAWRDVASAGEALQRNATPAARRFLEELAGGNPGARLTQQAKGVLRR